MENASSTAFPIVTMTEVSFGLTKKEYFAGLAMQALVTGKNDLMDADIIAEKAVRMANELLKKLENDA